MADRKQFVDVPEVSPELLQNLKAAMDRGVSDDELREQRISFAFGNSLNTASITKDSVRRASESVRLLSGAE